MTNRLRLSASKIKLLNDCSWKYFANYILNFPNSPNDGSSRGSVVHNILECLQKPKRHHQLDGLKSDIRSNRAVNRIVQKLAKQHNVTSEENIDLIYKFLWVALTYDFLCEGGRLQEPEYAFELEGEDNSYYCVGFIDKAALYPESSKIKIVDYKTSKAKFPKDELKNNIQALMYSLAMHKRYPEYDSEVEFQFLKFHKAPIQSVSFDKNQILGFEEYLKQIYTYLSDFTLEKAKSNLAANNGKSWLCGRCEYPGELKDTGEVKWCCPFKFPFSYYAIVDEDNNNTKTAYFKEDLNYTPQDNVVKKKYAGCPKFF